MTMRSTETSLATNGFQSRNMWNFGHVTSVFCQNGDLNVVTLLVDNKSLITGHQQNLHSSYNLQTLTNMVDWSAEPLAIVKTCKQHVKWLQIGPVLGFLRGFLSVSAKFPFDKWQVSASENMQFADSPIKSFVTVCEVHDIADGCWELVWSGGSGVLDLLLTHS